MTEAREFVLDHMESTGTRRARLTERQWGFVFLAGDGAGTISETFARSVCWDLSHVRDSSDAGFDRMMDALLVVLRKNGRRSCTTCRDMVFHNPLIAHPVKV